MIKRYSQRFYENQSSGSRHSAERILPFVIERLQPKNILDVGCGVGTWLSVAESLGIHDILGMDGEYVKKPQIKAFKPTDLSSGWFYPGKKFDLAICLEVAEHIPASSAGNLVRSICESAKSVLFSAAVPFQGGTHHVNEQWPEYWYKLFHQHGMTFVDCIRPKFWDDPDVDWWYAQNAFLVLPIHSPLVTADESPKPLVHPRAWESFRGDGLVRYILRKPSIKRYLNFA